MAEETIAKESQRITSRPPLVDFTREDATPPARVYIQQHDRGVLRVHNSASSAVVVLRFEILRPDGHIQNFEERLTPSTDRASSTKFFGLTEGFLLRAVAFAAAGTPKRGQTFVQFSILRGRLALTEEVEAILSDYVSEGHVISYPGSVIRSPLEGPGFIRVITGTDPAAGVEITETVPTNARWRFIGALLTLVTDATAANRQPFFIVSDGSSAWFSFSWGTVVTASLTAFLNAATGVVNTAPSAIVQMLTVPIDLYMLAGHDFQTSTFSLQAGDNWAAPIYSVEEWIED